MGRVSGRNEAMLPTKLIPLERERLMFKLQEAQLKAKGATPLQRLAHYARMYQRGHLPACPAVFLVLGCAGEIALENHDMELPACWDSIADVLGPPEVRPEWVIAVLRDVAMSHCHEEWSQWVDLLADIIEMATAERESLTGQEIIQQQSLQEHYARNRQEGSRWLGDATCAVECWN